VEAGSTADGQRSDKLDSVTSTSFRTDEQQLLHIMFLTRLGRNKEFVDPVAIQVKVKDVLCLSVLLGIGVHYLETHDLQIPKANNLLFYSNRRESVSDFKR
jgi:hypothetical protein